MDVRWSKGYEIPISESIHVPPITNYILTFGVTNRAVTLCISLELPFLVLSPWRDVMCNIIGMLCEAAVRSVIDCIIKIST